MKAALARIAVAAILTVSGWSAVAAQASAAPAGGEPCTKAQIEAASCLPTIQLEGLTEQESAIVGAVRGGRADLADKFISKLPESDRPTALRARDSASDGGDFSIMGGNDGVVVNNQEWEFEHTWPISSCLPDETDCDPTGFTVTVRFGLDLEFDGTAVVRGSFSGNGGLFGFKDLNCTLKKNVVNNPDPVRGEFSTCNGVDAPRTTGWELLNSSINHSYSQEDNWVSFQWNPYDPLTGYSQGRFEVKTPNWFKHSSGLQSFADAETPP